MSDARTAVASVAQDVAERPAVRDDPGRTRGERAIDDAVLGDDAREVQLGDDLDDPRPADAGDAGLAGRLGEVRRVRPRLDADDPEARLERGPVDAHALDGPRRRTLSAADLGALEGRTGRAGRGEQPSLVAQDDLRVRADVDEQGHPVRQLRFLGEDDPGRVGAHVTGDTGQDVDAGSRMGPESEVGRGRVDRPVRRQGERRAAERGRVDAEQEVVHDRIADQREIEDVGALDPGSVGEAARASGRSPGGPPWSSPRRPRDASSRTTRGS